MLKILVVTYQPWRDDLSVGNTLSNIFNGMESKIEIANLYIRDDKPSNHIVKRFFHVSESSMAKNFLRFKHKDVGEEVISVSDAEIKESFSRSYNKARQLRWDIFLYAQDLLGAFSKWQSKALDRFFKDFNPDLIFGPLGRVPITNRIMSTLSNKYKIPLVAYPWDDHFSLKKISFSPFFWARLFLERKYIRSCVEQSKFLYTITPLMKDEYSKYFNKECKLLYKGYSFAEKPLYKEPSEPILISYMGNVGAGRCKTLANIVSIINKINLDGEKFKLNIYTVSPITNKIRKVLNTGSCMLLPPVPSNEVMRTMQSSDILLHVEPKNLKERLQFRLSFSTKIVDYLYNAKCILAVGDGTGTIEYLRENKCAIIAKNDTDVANCLKEIYNDPAILMKYSDKAWECGKTNHQISKIQDSLLLDLQNIISDADKQA